MTLAQLRALLALAHGPAVEREPEGIRSPAGLAHVYLGHEVADLLLRDEVAAEPNAVKALALAVEHVLATR